jgi:bleomycin hydrolase
MSRFLILATFVSLYGASEPSILETINPTELNEACLEIEQDPHFRMVRNVLTQNPNYLVAQNWDAVNSMNFLFSHEISASFKITDQEKSGRCWIFGALNMLRNELCKKIPVRSFEFSQSYLFFHDKAERANLFLEEIIKTWKKPLDSVKVRHLLNCPIHDGGDWNNFVSLVNKYGLVPKSIYPDNDACYFSRPFNEILSTRLTKDAYLLRKLLESGATIEAAREEKQKMLKEIYQILVVHMGSPPSTFDYCYFDKEDNLYQFKNITPLDFADECLDRPLNDYVALIHSPREETPYYKNFRIISSHFMVGGKDLSALNLPIEELKEITKELILSDHAALFAADILNQADRSSGLLDANLYEFNHLYRTDFSMDKTTRLQYRFSAPNHCMVFTGVHLEEEVPIRWKVENSWGADCGKNGFFVMNDNWFDEYVFEIIVPKDHLPEDLQELLSDPPMLLKPWDPLWDPTY